MNPNIFNNDKSEVEERKQPTQEENISKRRDMRHTKKRIGSLKIGIFSLFLGFMPPTPDQNRNIEDMVEDNSTTNYIPDDQTIEISAIGIFSINFR